MLCYTTYNHEGTIYKASRLLKRVNVCEYDKTIRTKYKGELKPFAVRIAKALKEGFAEYVKTLGKHIYLYKLRG